MASCISIKHMFLLCFLLLSAIAEGRRLCVELKSRGREKVEPHMHQVEPHMHQVEPKQVEGHELSGAEGEGGGDEVLVGMDYTPASRKSPVHN